MNTTDLIAKAMKDVQEIRERGSGTTELNLATGVYNQLVDLQVDWEEQQDPESADEFLDDTLEIINAHRPSGMAPATGIEGLADSLHYALDAIVTHVNFIKAYGMEYDK